MKSYGVHVIVSLLLVATFGTPIFAIAAEERGPSSKKTLVGRIVSIDSKQGDIVVETDERRIKVSDIYHYFGQVSEGLRVTVSGADFSARLRNFNDFKVGDTVEIVYEEGNPELVSMQRRAGKKAPPAKKGPKGCDMGGAVASPGLIERNPFTGEERECVKKGDQYIWIKRTPKPAK